MTEHGKDGQYMEEALALARKGIGRTSPNPMVGAVLVKNGRIVGRGYHRRAGLPHAEIEAIKNARGRAKGATLYVNLEPCAHWGRTPPCVPAIIQAGIARVVCAATDPNRQVRGGGAAKLRRAGIKVSMGTRADEARNLNEVFYTYHEKRRPFVALKFAASLDGKLATRERDSKWITSAAARAFARKLRSRYDAVLVGANTVLADDPHLGARAKGRRDPLRVILDARLRIPLAARVLRDQNGPVAVSSRAPKSKKTRLMKRGIPVITFAGSTVPLPALLAQLRKRGITSVLVEGGGNVLGQFLDARAADRVYVFYGPLLIGGGNAVGIGGKGAALIKNAPRLKTMSVTPFGTTLLVSGAL